MGPISRGVLGPEMCGVTTTLSKPQSGMVGGQGLGVEDVEHRAADAAPAQRVQQRGLVHDRPARQVEQPGGGLHRGQLGRAQEAAGLLAQRQRQDHEVRAGERRAEAPSSGRRARRRARARPLRVTPITRMPRARAALRDGAADIAEPDDAEGLAAQAAPGSTGAHRRCRWLARKPSMRWVTQRHQPSVYSAIHGPKMPAARVTRTPRGQLGHEQALDAGAHALDPAEPLGAGEQRARRAPAVEDLRVGARPGGLVRGGGHVHAEGARRQTDEIGVGAGFRRVRVVHEDAAGHAPILASSRSSNEKSTGRSARPWARYHSQVWASPACERVAGAEAQLVAQLRGGVDGVAVVDQVLAEDGARLVEALEQGRVEVPQRDRPADAPRRSARRSPPGSPRPRPSRCRPARRPARRPGARPSPRPGPRRGRTAAASRRGPAPAPGARG